MEPAPGDLSFQAPAEAQLQCRRECRSRLRVAVPGSPRGDRSSADRPRCRRESYAIDRRVLDCHRILARTRRPRVSPVYPEASRCTCQSQRAWKVGQPSAERQSCVLATPYRALAKFRRYRDMSHKAVNIRYHTMFRDAAVTSNPYLRLSCSTLQDRGGLQPRLYQFGTGHWHELDHEVYP